MGNGHLLIGEGLGGATVFDPTPAIQQFGNIIAQQRAEKQAKDQALINQMSQLKPDVIRDADRQDYRNKFDDWKQTAINANNLPRNSRDRLDAIAAAQSKYQDLGNFISESKKEAAHENAISNSLIQNPHLFSDDAHTKLIKSMQAPMSDSNFVPGQQYSTLERYIDPVKQDDAFDKINKTALKQSTWSNPIQSQGIDKQGNKTGVVTHNEREVSPEDVLAMHAHQYTLSKDTKNYIDKKYANIEGSNPHETMMLRLRQNALDRGDISVGADGALQTEVNEKTKPEFKANYAPDKFYAHYDYRLDNPTPTQQQGQQPIYRQKLVSDILSGVPNSGEQLAAKIKADPTYDGDLTMGVNKYGQKVFYIPAKRKWDATNGEWTQTSPQRIVPIDPKDPNANIKLNEMINQLTGEKVDISALQTPGGKKHLPIPGASSNIPQVKQQTTHKKSDPLGLGL